MPSDTSKKPDLQLLMQAYFAVRDDGRNHWNLIAALVAVGVAVLGFIGTIASQQVCRGPIEADCSPPLVWLFLPLLPLALTALLVQQVAIHFLRSFYERALERLLAGELKCFFLPDTPSGPVLAKPEEHASQGAGPQLPVPCMAHLAQLLFDRAGTGARRWLARLNNYGNSIIMALVNFGVIGLSAWKLHEHPGYWPFLSLYVVLLLSLATLTFKATKASFWDESIRKLEERFKGTLSGT